MIVRIAPTKGTKTTVDVHVGSNLVASLTLGEDASESRPPAFGGSVDPFSSAAWSEQSFVVPAGDAKEKTPVELVARQGSFSSYHYWFIRE